MTDKIPTTDEGRREFIRRLVEEQKREDMVKEVKELSDRFCVAMIAAGRAGSLYNALILTREVPIVDDPTRFAALYIKRRNRILGDWIMLEEALDV